MGDAGVPHVCVCSCPIKDPEGLAPQPWVGLWFSVGGTGRNPGEVERTRLQGWVDLRSNPGST